MDYSFSLAKRSDTPEVLKLYLTLTETSGCVWAEGTPNRDIVEETTNAELLYIVTDKKYKIIAAVLLQTSSEEYSLSCSTIENMCRIRFLGVLPEYQNKGIGRFLLRKLISTMRRKGFSGISALVGKQNLSAQQLFRQSDFQQSSEITVSETEYYCWELKF